MKFDYKLFFNGGEEYGSYQQAIKHLNLDDDTVCFFLHDDLVLKSFDFITICIDALKTHKVIGNCMNYGENSYDPNKVIEIGIKEEFDNKTRIDYVKDENKHFFDRGAIPLKTVRPSFVCMKYDSVKEIGGFEPREEAYVSPSVTEGGKPYYRGCENLADTKTGGLSVFGNLFPNLTVYKVNKIFGKDSITWLSDSYRDSKYLHECERGEL